MRKVVVSLDKETTIEIYQMSSASGYEFVMVNYDHPNSGISPWFFLWKNQQTDWDFITACSANEEWIRKVLCGVKTGTLLDEWLESTWCG